MKKLPKAPMPMRLTASKENHEVKSQCRRQDSMKKFEGPIDEWKEITDRVILTDTTNQCRNKKYSLPSKSRFSTVQSVFVIEEENNRKLSEIEILKRQAIFLEDENMQQRRTNTEFMKTEPACMMDIIPIRLDNWLKTTSNGFFRSQQRHSLLQKKRSRIKRLRKIDLLKVNLLTQSNTKVFKEELFKQIQEINKPMILYPLMDTIYHQEIKQRLNSTSLKSKRALRRPKNSASACRQSRQFNRQEPIRVKTVGSWKSEMKLPSNSAKLEDFDSLFKTKYNKKF